MKQRIIAFWLVAFVAIVHVSAQESTNRPAIWARKIDIAGVGNCYQVTTNLYRGAQPTAEGMKHLKALGIRTVVNLRSFHSDKQKISGTGLRGMRFEAKPWHADLNEVVGFLKVAADTNNLPVFVHCERGADRTGLMCAMYRICICDWPKNDAIAEMKQGGFNFSPVWSELVSFIERSDIADIKRRMLLAGK